MTSTKFFSRMIRLLPGPMRSAAKRFYFRSRHWANPGLKGTGTVQDLYYWVADGHLDTLLLLQNYFTVFYPTIPTDTMGVLDIFDEQGISLGSKRISVGGFGCTKLRVSSVLKELQAEAQCTFGTLQWHLDVPKEVPAREPSFYFFDRFYIGYVNKQNQPCFVHGVDRTRIYREDKPAIRQWYRPGRKYEWAPEIPVDIDNYKEFEVILINRTSRIAKLSLMLLDSKDQSRSWESEIQPNGVHRFELTPEATSGLIPRELRMRIRGMPTPVGRPLVFKKFANGAISVMHC